MNHDPIAQRNNSKTSYTTHCVHGSRHGCYWSQRWWFHFKVVVQWKRDNEKKDEEKASKVFNNGLLWSNGCHLYTEECVDAKLEPGVGGIVTWMALQKQILSKISRCQGRDFICQHLYTRLSWRDTHPRRPIYLKKRIAFGLFCLATGAGTLLWQTMGRPTVWPLLQLLPSPLSAMFVMLNQETSAPCRAEPWWLLHYSDAKVGWIATRLQNILYPT